MKSQGAVHVFHPILEGVRGPQNVKNHCTKATHLPIPDKVDWSLHNRENNKSRSNRPLHVAASLNEPPSG